jgi:hypothetical protein
MKVKVLSKIIHYNLFLQSTKFLRPYYIYLCLNHETIYVTFMEFAFTEANFVNAHLGMTGSIYAHL